MTFNTIEKDVADILEYNHAARADDMVLYAAYVWEKVQGLGYGKGWLEHVFSDRRFRLAHGIAPYESVSRIRRMVQEKDETLRATPETIEEKKRIERNYRNYARGLEQ